MALSISNALNKLSTHDIMLRQAIAQADIPPLREYPAGFMAFVRIIIAQQISKHVADSIINKIYQDYDDFTPYIALELGELSLRHYGLSARKASYILGLSQHIIDGTFDIDGLEHYDDETIITMITSLKGFGRWSAEIYALFSLKRYDIFPAGDLALQQALRHLYQLDTRPDEATSRQLVAHLSPYRGFMAMFLWHYYHKMPTL